ncbi:hypothetical protein H4219_003784, partial [Mycoemilia scoparia]
VSDNQDSPVSFDDFGHLGLRSYIADALGQLYGSTGTGFHVDILSLDYSSQCAIIRVAYQ